jgi:MuDR family transposase
LNPISHYNPIIVPSNQILDPPLIEYEGEFYSYDQNDPKMDVGVQYSHVVAFRRALSHYTVINHFELNLGKTEPSRVTATCASRDCNWRIHATIAEDGVTFIVRTLQAKHTCCGDNRSGNKHANKGWIVDIIVDDLRKEGDVSVKELKQRVETKFSISLPYNRVWKAKEQAVEEIYEKWKDSLVQVRALREKIL